MLLVVVVVEAVITCLNISRRKKNESNELQLVGGVK